MSQGVFKNSNYKIHSLTWSAFKKGIVSLRKSSYSYYACKFDPRETIKEQSLTLLSQEALYIFSCKSCATLTCDHVQRKHSCCIWKKKRSRVAFNLQPGQNNSNIEKSASCGREIIHLTLLEINVLQVSYDAPAAHRAIALFKYIYISGIF